MPENGELTQRYYQGFVTIVPLFAVFSMDEGNRVTKRNAYEAISY